MIQANEIFGNQNSFPGKISTEECGIDSAVNIHQKNPKDVENPMETKKTVRTSYIHVGFSIHLLRFFFFFRSASHSIHACFKNVPDLVKLDRRMICWLSSHSGNPNLFWYMAMSQNPGTPGEHKIAGKWMFIPLKMVLIGIDPYPYRSLFGDDHPLWWLYFVLDHTYGFCMVFVLLSSFMPFFCGCWICLMLKAFVLFVGGSIRGGLWRVWCKQWSLNSSGSCVDKTPYTLW